VSVLSKIAADVMDDVRKKSRERPIETMDLVRKKRYSLVKAIETAPKVPLIAEIKRASPSAGNIRPDANALDVAKEMLAGGAVALSVLTEKKYFKGDSSFIPELRKFVEVPLLRKDFIVDEYQLYEAAELGADAVLLIVKLLGDKTSELLHVAEGLGMDALVETTTESEIERAVSSGAKLIGINNRDLDTLEIDLTRTEKLAPLVSEDVTLVSESGINSTEDVRRMLDAGADAVLVGTALMKSENIKQKVRELMEARR
jgi:indole-3-glycerol phosphate synthase